MALAGSPAVFLPSGRPASLGIILLKTLPTPHPTAVRHVPMTLPAPHSAALDGGASRPPGSFLPCYPLSTELSGSNTTTSLPASPAGQREAAPSRQADVGSPFSSFRPATVLEFLQFLQRDAKPGAKSAGEECDSAAPCRRGPGRPEAQPAEATKAAGGPGPWQLPAAVHRRACQDPNPGRGGKCARGSGARVQALATPRGRR